MATSDPADTTAVVDGDAQQAVFENESSSSGRTKRFVPFGGIRMAQGYAINGVARGAIVMSNIFLATSIVFLANQQAGCLDEDDKTIPDCQGKVYGMAPSTVVSNLAVVVGVLSAFFMPLCGAILDYTSHRKLVGVVVTVLMILIQAVQIYTVESTWFPMTILQALSGFFYQILVLSVYAYLPDLARIGGYDLIRELHPKFTALQFTAQITFLVMIVAVQNVFQTTDVRTAQYSQAINTVWITIAFASSWRLMMRVPPQRTLAPGQSLAGKGFAQVGKTITKIYREYRGTLGLFYPAVIFAEAATNAFTTISVIFLADHMGWGAGNIGIFFICALLGIIPGTFLGGYFTRRLNPKDSWRLGLLFMVIITIIGAFSLNRDTNPLATYAWGLGIGITLGWHYPVESIIFSLCMPRGQDAEFTGFYVYCTQILVWLPPLVFSGLVQAGISQSFGVFVVAMFAVVAVLIISLFPKWDDMLAAFQADEAVKEQVEMFSKANGDSTSASAL